MKISVLTFKLLSLLCLILMTGTTVKAQIIISQYYEGTGTNKWIELTNTSNTAINTTSPQLKLGLWSVTGSTGNISLTGAPSSTVNLTVTIPAFGSVLIGNTGNGTEIPYLTAASAAMTSNSVINFNGNDGVALLDASNNIIDAFGTGINATDVSYVRTVTVTSASTTYLSSQWTSATIANVQNASTTDPTRLGYQLSSACTAPNSQPSGLSFGSPTSTSISGSFTATTANEYLVVISTSALNTNPSNGTVYTPGNTLGNGTILSRGTSTSFNATGLSSSTTFYFTVFALNSVSCSAGPIYNTTTPLNGSIATIASPCVAPLNQPTGLSFGSPTSTSISGSFTATTANEYLVVYSTSALNTNPSNGTIYTAGNTLGNGTVLSRGTSISFNATGISSSTVYYFTFFALNSVSCSAGPVYNTTTPLNGSIATTAPPCVAPPSQPTGLSFSSVTSSTASGSFTTTIANEYMVVYSTSATLTANPINGTIYNAGNTFGNATVVSRGTGNTFAATGLTPLTTYYFKVFSLNSMSCSAGPIYNTSSPLSGFATTLEAPLYYYYGNFHSHSEYSDGTGTPSGDFAYGDTSNCMDFLGISEHNHVSAGMSLANWIAGRSQAAAANTPTFLAMYGMEWGVISGGGHVVVYGVDQLLGWDAGQYQTYVPQSVYTGTTGLFNVIKSFGSNAMATLAHPNNADYNGIMSTYDSIADDVIVGSAVENGPSTSTNTTYTDPPASMTYLSFYRNMLARGYHLGPTIDHDNHNVTHGHTATTRTVVMSPSLSENDILGSMKLMRFYASQDCAAQVSFKIGTAKIGSIVTAAGAPIITVTTTTSNPVTSLKIYSGVPGSGSNATILTSTTTGSITYTHTALANLTNRYYYIDITESDGKRIVTAPIWYSRNDAVKMSKNSNTFSVAEFFAIPETNKVTLKWVTINEKADQTFMIERSYDNTVFETLAFTTGKGVSSFPNNYTITDSNSQDNGFVYYRLTQHDSDGNVVFIQNQKVERVKQVTFDATVYPNPVTDKANIIITDTNGELIELSIHSLTGQLVYRQNISTEKGDKELILPINELRSGIYFLTLTSGNHVVTTKISKL